mgnify:CR=1 FL=1
MSKKPYWGVVPTKIRGKKLNGKIVLAAWNQFSGRAEFTAEFPFEYRKQNEVLRLTTYVYPQQPDGSVVNGVILDQFGKVFGVDFNEPGKLEDISSVADLEHREIEIDAVVDIGPKGSSYYRIYGWKINDTPTKVLHKASTVRPAMKELETRRAEKLERELIVVTMERDSALHALEAYQVGERTAYEVLLQYKCRLEELFPEEKLYEMFPELYYPVQECELERYDDEAKDVVPISDWAAKELAKRRELQPPPKRREIQPTPTDFDYLSVGDYV